MGWLRALAAVVVCGGLVGGVVGCSDDGPEAGPSPSPTVSVSTSGSASPSEEVPVAPVLPEAAKVATEAGARAFIAYYWELINYAQVTGDVAVLGTMSARTCDVCTGFVDDLRKHYAAGGRIIGGRNAVRVISASQIETNSKSALGYRLELDVSHDGQEIAAADGTSEARDAGSNRFTAYLLWADQSRWRVDVMELR